MKKTNSCMPEETGGLMVAKVLPLKARGLKKGQKEKARRAREKARRGVKEGQTQKRKAKRVREKTRMGLKKARHRRERQEGKGKAGA